MKEQNLYHHIDAYLEGTLDADHDFVSRLQTDPDLVEEVALQKLVREVVLDKRLAEVSRQIHSLKPQNSVPFFTGKGLVLLLSLTATLVATWYFLFRPAATVQHHKATFKNETHSPATLPAKKSVNHVPTLSTAKHKTHTVRELSASEYHPTQSINKVRSPSVISAEEVFTLQPAFKITDIPDNVSLPQASTHKLIPTNSDVCDTATISYSLETSP